MTRCRTVFMGTPDFSVPCLERLIAISEVIGVVTQPDKPRGRGQKMSPSPVKTAALKAGIPVYQPQKVRDEAFVRTLAEMAPDLIVVVAFGQILSEQVLSIPPMGCINVHASLLPRYRGAAPMQWCLINGESETGVTTMMMDKGLDTGDMLEKKVVSIHPDMTLEELHDTLSVVGAELLENTVKKLLAGSLRREKQNDADSNYAPMIRRETGRIDWQKPAGEIHNLVRALDSWPGAYAELDGKTYKIWRTKVLEDRDGAAGEILEAGTAEIIVGTGKGAVAIMELQAPGGRRLRAADYLRGHGFSPGSRFAL